MSLSGVYCRIVNEGVYVDGSERLVFDQKSAADNLTDLYKKEGIEYPKFHKMDLMSKASLLAVEILKERCPQLAGCADDAIGLLFANSESSSATDLKFRDSYEKDQLPSPSLFVYTLPNIAMGEIAIRNKWYGSHMFAVFPNFAPAYFTDYGRLMLSNGASFVIGGWVDVRDGLDILVFVMDGRQEKVVLEEDLETIYRKYR